MAIKKENIARFGLSAMGFVYILVGILTALKAFNLGGKEVGTKGAIGFLSGKPIDHLLLGVIAGGLLSYTFWRFYQTFMDTRDMGTDLNALFVRLGFFSGGLFYGFLGFVAIKTILEGSFNRQSEILVSLLNSSYSGIITIIIGVVFAGKAVFEWYFVLSDKFKKNIQVSKMTAKVKRVLLNFGVLGHSARGVLFGIMSFLTIRTGLTFRDEKMSQLTDAFQFIDKQFGAYILALIAFGMLCFGLFMIVKSRYLYINMK